MSLAPLSQFESHCPWRLVLTVFEEYHVHGCELVLPTAYSQRHRQRLPRQL